MDSFTHSYKGGGHSKCAWKTHAHLEPQGECAQIKELGCLRGSSQLEKEHSALVVGSDVQETKKQEGAAW